MEGMNSFVGMPSPQTSLPYVAYCDAAEPYVDNYSSASQSPMNSPYDLSCVADLNGIPNSYPSPERETSEDAAQTEGSGKEAKLAAKRKRENRYKNAPPSVLSRRRAQNRASQRAYRERKDQRIKDLEQLLGEAKQRNDVLSQAYAELHSEYVKTKASQLQDAATSYPAVDMGYEPQPAIPYADRLEPGMYVYPAMNVPPTGYHM